MSIEFFRQEYWSGLLFPSPEDLPDPGIEPGSLVPPALAGGFFTTGAALEALLVAAKSCFYPGFFLWTLLGLSCSSGGSFSFCLIISISVSLSNNAGRWADPPRHVQFLSAASC